MQLVSSTNLEPGDIAVIVSYSGLTKEIIEIARNVKLCGGKIIAITKYGTNKLSSMSDYNLFVPMLEQPLRVGASSRRVSQLSVVDIVYNTYLSMEKDKSMEKILSTNKLLEKKKRIDKSFYPYSAFRLRIYYEINNHFPDKKFHRIKQSFINMNTYCKQFKQSL